MGIALLLLRPGSLLRILREYRDYAFAFLEILSIPFLLRTLFSPWKGIIERYPTRGFQWDRILEAFTLNVVTRVIGMVVRVLTLVLALLMQIALLLFFFTRLALWYAFPVLLFFIPRLLDLFP